MVELFDSEEENGKFLEQCKADQKIVESQLSPKIRALPSSGTARVASEINLILPSWCSVSLAEL